MTHQEVLQLLNDPKRAPESFRNAQKRWKDVYYGISLHTLGARPAFKRLGRGGTVYPQGYYGPEYQRIFDDVLFSRHPRENEETRQWRFSQYKTITRTPFLQILEIVSGAIFQDSNYNVEIPDPQDEDFMITENNFDGYDLMGWFANVGVQAMMEDPNGIFVRLPSKPYYEISERKVPVSLWFVNSKDIVFLSSELLLFKRGDHAYLIDRSNIFRFTYDQKNRAYYQTEDDKKGYYATRFGRLPIDIAGGLWNSHGFYDSHLVKAQAVADDFVSSYSAEQMVDKEAAHPYIIQAEEECPTCNGKGSVQVTCDDCPGGYDLKECGLCEGKGTTSVSPGDRMNVPAEMMDKDLIKIVNPDVNINKYHHEKTNNIFNRILDALNLLKVQQAQSGTAKAIDQERLYQFVAKIANQLFDKLIYNTIADIIAYRNAIGSGGDVRPAQYPFTLTKPTQYQIKTAADLLEEYSNANKANLPAYIRHQMAKDYVEKQYSGDEVFKKVSDTILRLDVLSVYSEEEKLTKATNFEIDRNDLVFSLRLPTVLRDIVSLQGEEWFLSASHEQLKSFVDERMNSYVTEPALLPHDLLS